MVSFGFKYGIPVDADMVADMRFLPNPHWDPDAAADVRARRAGPRLRARPARRGRLPRPATRTCSASLTGGFVREGKRFLTLAVGCTGGRHRSVAMAEALAERLRSHDVDASWSCTATWAASDAPGLTDASRAGSPAPESSRSAAGTGWPRRCPRCGTSARG